MSRKVHVKVTFDVYMVADDDALVQDVVNEMECTMTDTTGKADIQDFTMTDYEVGDSR